MRRLARTRPAAPAGIVHLGPGAFFRAFVAACTEDAMAAGGGDWGILAASLRSPRARDALAPQGCAYTAVELGPGGRRARLVQSVSGALVAPEDPGAAVAAMADGRVRIVSLTITEKGYCLEPGAARLDAAHPDVARDLASPNRPRSAPGLLAAALARRREAGLAPFALLSCDNLPSNGRAARRAVLDFAEARGGGLAGWIADGLSCPSTMVDRITPAATEEDLAALARERGVEDRAAVFHEPFMQWVVEDDFPLGRPAWEAGGAAFVRDVAAHEAMKLRCLNGTHSALAYLGYLAGHETIADCVADPPFAAFCERLWSDEIMPTVAEPEGESLPAYAAALMERYRNPAIRHRTWQIAMDGSRKLPQRILGAVSDNLARERLPRGLCLAVAAWMRYVGGTDEAGAPIDVRDPIAAELRALSDGAGGPRDKAAALLASEVFDPALAGNPAFADAVGEACEALAERGARQAVADWLAGEGGERARR